MEPTGTGEVFVHPTAIVEPGSSIGPGSRIWHHVHIREGAIIGTNCTLGKNVFVDLDAQIGSNSKVQNNVSIYAGVTLDEEVFVGPSVVFTNDRVPRAGSPEWEIVRTRVHRGASLGANATLIAGIEIGAWALVGAGSVVTKDVGAHEIVIGNPAARQGWICRCGKTRVQPEAKKLACDRCGTTLDLTAADLS